MKGRPVEQLVFEYMFPKPRQPDLQNFHALLQRNLIPEVRLEVQSFYGHLDTAEAKYPGLDYCRPIHRIRLSRWPWHRRLFRAFDALRLTPNEIAGLTKWEGTKWAKERYEREQNIVIVEMSDDEISDWVEPEDRSDRLVQRSGTRGIEGQDEPADGNEGDESDEELESVGVDLNERLRERVALRNVSGDTSMPLDEEWEQWLKQAIETGELPLMADQISRSLYEQDTMTPDNVFTARMFTAARTGNWHEIPDSLHDIFRHGLEGERQSSEEAQQSAAPANSSSRTASDPPAPSTSVRGRLIAPNFNTQDQRPTYSSLRLPVDDGGTVMMSDIRVQRTARPNA
ncbi:hypothetical protein QBC33DRAFT_580104 [Phialemonium atrogriseum]|uniref:Uncharacterized protein n=1 Tax=Phialemonium atrogriseum TaxID=1093897 RepID=A0AAJ0BXE7_9PEZI|nr:uncharacterized protein QBC33DRAFT_580104 [Phialemonium atrogriseum]KAK1764842.1 hypothetical protein QBC33DRAFT_580104 [Phialemonium atrogriseum]